MCGCVLLLLRAGNWQWELHQRHQHLLRQYSAEGRDTAGLQAAFDAYLAAERQQQQQQASQQGQQGQEGEHETG
jgi:hypothetical protein